MRREEEYVGKRVMVMDVPMKRRRGRTFYNHSAITVQIVSHHLLLYVMTRLTLIVTYIPTNNLVLIDLL